MVFRDTQFTSRAQHALREHTAHLGFFNLEITRQHGTNHGARHLDPGAHVRCTADDLQQGLLTDIDFTDVQVVRVFMIAAGDDLSNNDTGKGRSHRTHFFDFQTGHRHGFTQLVGGQFRIDIGA